MHTTRSDRSNDTVNHILWQLHKNPTSDDAKENQVVLLWFARSHTLRNLLKWKNLYGNQFHSPFFAASILLRSIIQNAANIKMLHRTGPNVLVVKITRSRPKPSIIPEALIVIHSKNEIFHMFHFQCEILWTKRLFFRLLQLQSKWVHYKMRRFQWIKHLCIQFVKRNQRSVLANVSPFP